jgi:hypothetical protein
VPSLPLASLAALTARRVPLEDASVIALPQTPGTLAEIVTTPATLEAVTSPAKVAFAAIAATSEELQP